MNKKLLIGVGILAGAGLAYYLWKKNQPITEEKSKATGRLKPNRNLGGSTSGGTNKEVLVGSNWGSLSCPKGQFTCSKDVNSCCRFASNTLKT